MSSLATLFALEQEFGIQTFVTPFQLEMLGQFFQSEKFKKVARKIDIWIPNWEKLNWTYSYP